MDMSMINHFWRKTFLLLRRPSVFLSYRRQDSQSITDRLYDALVSKLGRKNVFKDVDSIGGGDQIAKQIHRFVNAADVLVAIIGPDWEASKKGDLQRRIDDGDDWVRTEIETAFDSGVRVLPVFVNKRETPPQMLPGTLQRLICMNFLRVRDDPDFKQDQKRLLRALGYRWWHERTRLLISFIGVLVVVFAIWSFPIVQIYNWDNVMVANFSRGQWDAAEVIADRILRKDPNHLRAVSVKGSVAALSGQYITAQRFFQQAYEIAPESRPVRRNLAYAMLHSGRVDDAVKLYEGLRDGTAAAEYSVACAYVAAARYADAIKVIRALPNTQLALQEGNLRRGQAPILEAAALIGRGVAGDRELAIGKVRFAVAQDREYWLPILLGKERDPQNDYQIQIRLLEPILEESLRTAPTMNLSNY
jgi:tetratricopeptide (TPR) repeat protein